MRSPWYCPHCQVSVSNDHAWLDHINGKAHHKKLGFSMRLKRHSDDEVRVLSSVCGGGVSGLLRTGRFLFSRVIQKRGRGRALRS